MSISLSACLSLPKNQPHCSLYLIMKYVIYIPSRFLHFSFWFFNFNLAWLLKNNQIPNSFFYLGPEVYNNLYICPTCTDCRLLLEVFKDLSFPIFIPGTISESYTYHKYFLEVQSLEMRRVVWVKKNNGCNMWEHYLYR